MRRKGRSAKFDLLVPYGRFSGTGEVAGQPQQREMTGFGDPLLRFSVNFLAEPLVPAPCSSDVGPKSNT